MLRAARANPGRVAMPVRGRADKTGRMPEVEFTIRWADGSRFDGHSPSRAIERWVVEGGVYPRAELVRRVQIALREASERNREVCGFGGTEAAEASVAFTAAAAGDPDEPAVVQRLARGAQALRYPPPRRFGGHVDVVVIGGGHAGLSISWHLRSRSVDHVVLERGALAGAWRSQRWDAFRTLTPNWQCRLPGHPYPGQDPDGFMARDEIVEHLESYAESFNVPLCEGVAVNDVRADAGGGFIVTTGRGRLHCDQLVLAVGAHQHPRIPALAAGLAPAITQLTPASYRNPTSPPDGAVLVVGAGQSGVEIAEDLMRAGRDVHLSVGSATAHDLASLTADGLHRHGRLTASDGEVLRFAGPPADELDLRAAGIRTAVWATGFRADWSWVKLPLLDGDECPAHERGISTQVPGLYLLGLPWERARASSSFDEVAFDAEHIAGTIAERVYFPAGPYELRR